MSGSKKRHEYISLNSALHIRARMGLGVLKAQVHRAFVYAAYLRQLGNLIGRYERGEAVPSVEIAAKIANELNVSLDYLIGLSELKIDNALLNRIKEISTLSDDEQRQLYAVIDALLRDYKAKKAYSK